MSQEQNSFEETNESSGFSFESILAEVKGSAFINGDKKTPPDLLQEKADKILREAAEVTAAKQASVPMQTQTISSATEQTTGSIPILDAARHNFATQDSGEAPQTISSAISQTIPVSNISNNNNIQRPDLEPEFSDTDELPMIITPLDNEAPPVSTGASFAAFDAAMDEAVIESARQSAANNGDIPPLVIPINDEHRRPPQNTLSDTGSTRAVLFDQFGGDSGGEQNQDTIIHGGVPFDGEYYDEVEKKPRWGFGKGFGFFGKGSSSEEYSGYGEGEDELLEEPPLRDAVRKFATACNSISIRVMPASVITLLMVVLTYVYEAGMIVPFGIGYNLDRAAGTLVVCLLIVMMLCCDVLVRGVDFLIRGVPNAETLILFSCLFSLISATFTMVSGAAAMLPFCAVSALSLTFAAHGEKYNLRAITDTLKTAVGSSEPFGVQAEYNTDIDKSVLKKAYNRTDGFYNNLMQPDVTELTYSYAAPALLVGALLLTVLTVLIRGGVENSLHIMSALLAAAAPFSIILSFAIPFATVVKSTRRAGAAVAGWGGADDICFTDGVCVTDDDLFPPGMLKLSGVKVYDGASPENAIRYTASLILSSGSGLTSLFAEVLKQQGLSSMRVDNFECHESGIGALIRGEHVSTGSAAFMNLLGVRVPDDTNMKNAVYTAVNNRLVAMFAIDYKPLPSVQSALISMLKWRIDLYFAMRDFNVTPAMVGQKFKVPFDSFVFIPAKDSYSISDLHAAKPGRMAAVLVREGLNPYAEAITAGRLLKSAAFFATVLSIVSAALGVILMFYMCWTGSFLSASPGNLVIFMLCMLITVLIVCGYVRLKK